MDDIRAPQNNYTSNSAGYSQQPAVSQQPEAAPPAYSGDYGDAGGGSKLKTFFKWLLILILIAGAAYGVYMWQNKKVTELDAKVADQNSQINNLSAAAQNPATPDIEQTLADGTKIVVPFNSTNAGVIWWYSDAGTSAAKNDKDLSASIDLSTQGALQFLSSVPANTRNTVCRNVTNDTDAIHFGTLNTTTNKLSLQRQSPNCIEMLANSSLNKDAKLLKEASDVTAQAKKDLQAYVSSIKTQ